MICSTEQPRDTKCHTCNGVMGLYFCDLWDNGKRLRYHCDLCGFCHFGRKEDNKHCKVCKICYYHEDYWSHENHVKNSSSHNCPVCLEGPLNRQSHKVIGVMVCGHAIHQECYNEYTQHDYRCPLCRKTVFDPTAFFDIYRYECLMNPTPDEYKKKVPIFCNDCDESREAWFPSCIYSAMIVLRLMFQGSLYLPCGRYKRRVAEVSSLRKI